MNIALHNLIKGYKMVHNNITKDLFSSEYEKNNPNIEDKIIDRLRDLIKVMSIIIEFEK